MADDQAQIVERGMLLDRKADALLGLGLDAVGEIEVDDIACMFEIAGIEHDLERPLGVVLLEFGLGEVGEIAMHRGLIAVEPLIEGLELLQLLEAAASQRHDGGVEHAVEELAHAHRFERRV